MYTVSYCILRVSDQTGVSLQWYVVEIHRSGRKPSNVGEQIIQHTLSELFQALRYMFGYFLVCFFVVGFFCVALLCALCL